MKRIALVAAVLALSHARRRMRPLLTPVQLWPGACRYGHRHEDDGFAAMKDSMMKDSLMKDSIAKAAKK
jgi:hypothetical protein